MGWSKKQLIQKAFGKFGMTYYVFNAQPGDLQDAVEQLDAMIASWDGEGIPLGYPLPVTMDGGSLDTDSNIKDIYNEAVYLNLAVLLAPDYGKEVLPSTALKARRLYLKLLGDFVKAKSTAVPEGVPLGAGHRPNMGRSRNFTCAPEDELEASPGINLPFK